MRSSIKCDNILEILHVELIFKSSLCRKPRVSVICRAFGPLTAASTSNVSLIMNSLSAYGFSTLMKGFAAGLKRSKRREIAIRFIAFRRTV